jgi:hypothetical protein
LDKVGQSWTNKHDILHRGHRKSSMNQRKKTEDEFSLATILALVTSEKPILGLPRRQ